MLGRNKAESEIIPYTGTWDAKSRAEMAYAVDTLLVIILQDMQDPSSKSTTAGDNDEILFYQSLVPLLRRCLQDKTCCQDKKQLLFDMVFIDEQ